MDLVQIPTIGWAVIAFVASLAFIVLLLLIRKGILVTRRGRLPHSDTTVINGVTCATIARAAVDIACLGPPTAAVQAIMTARDHGVTRVRLLLTLNHCRGAASRGCPRAQHIIESVTFQQ